MLNNLQPNFGASLHILKVEIGGDAQSSGLTLHFLNIILPFIHSQNVQYHSSALDAHLNISFFGVREIQ